MADAVAGRLMKEHELSARVESKRKGKGIGYHLFVDFEGRTDKEAVEMRRRIQDEHQWKCEVIDKRNFPNIIVSPSSTLELYQQFLQSESVVPSDDLEQEAYDISAFWSVRNETLLFNWKDVEVFFEMPLDWSMEQTHSDLFQLLITSWSSPGTSPP